jgi:hypothetical protein
MASTIMRSSSTRGVASPGARMRRLLRREWSMTMYTSRVRSMRCTRVTGAPRRAVARQSMSEYSSPLM